MGNDSDRLSVNETKTQFFWRRRESRTLALCGSCCGVLMRWGPQQIQMLAEGSWERRWQDFLSDAPLPGGADECVAGGSMGDVFSCPAPPRGPPGLQLDLLQIDGGAVLTRQHAAASRVDKRSAALLTRPTGAELSLFFDPAALLSSSPPPPPPFRCSRAALFYCRLCLFDISLLLLLRWTESRHPKNFLGSLKMGRTSSAPINGFRQTYRGKLCPGTEKIFSLLNTTSRKLLFIQEN